MQIATNSFIQKLEKVAAVARALKSQRQARLIEVFMYVYVLKYHPAGRKAKSLKLNAHKCARVIVRTL